MAKDPAQRYPSVAALVEDLQRLSVPRSQPGTTRPASGPGDVISFAADQPVNPTLTGPTPPPAPATVGAERPRRRVLLGVLAGVGLVALGALLTLGLRPGSAATPTAGGGAGATASPASAASAGPGGASTGAVSRYTLRLSGSARAANVTLDVDGSSAA